MCPGSVALCKDLPSKSSIYADEGTLAHEIAAKVLQTGDWPDVMDCEMKEAIEVYTDAVLGEWTKMNPKKDKFLVEHRFDLSEIYPGCFGTADTVLYYFRDKRLSVWDYKHGAGTPVEVRDNSQLMFYALGALLSIGLPVAEVESVVCQPRCPHPDGAIRRWRFPAVDIMEFEADLVKYAKATEPKDAPLVPGDHCRWCKAAGICPAIKNKAVALAKLDFIATNSYDTKKLSEALEWVPRLEAWCKSVREFAYGEACHGRNPEGWKLVAKRATRKWQDDVTPSVLAMYFGLDEEEIMEAKLRSPAQVEKLLDKNLRKDLANYTVSKSSGYSLVPDSDAREPAKLDAKSDFSPIASDFLE